MGLIKIWLLNLSKDPLKIIYQVLHLVNFESLYSQ